jgi:hypothetical protein
MPTHHVAPNVDQERDMVYQTLRQYIHFSTVAPITQPTFSGVNRGGDWYYTDGEIAILSAVRWNRESVIVPRSPALTVKNWIFGMLFPGTKSNSSVSTVTIGAG